MSNEMNTAAPAEMTNDAADTRTATVTPRVDIVETENEFVLFVDLPGVWSDDVDVRFEKGELTVHGKRAAANTGRQPSLREYEATSYHRTFAVAETVAADKIDAELKNGVLTVRLPKAEAAKPRRISVKGE